MSLRYFCGGVGVAGFGDGILFFAGACCEFVFDVPCKTEDELGRRAAKIDNVIEVTMKMTAAQVVALLNRVADPRGPNAV